MADIFLSYAREDLPRIRELVEAFDASGLTVFWDRTIPPGKTWRRVIGAELQQASAVLVCWSAHSIESQWVLEEAEVGKQRGILLPVLFEKVEPPLGFTSIQAANLWPDSPARSEELDALVRAALALKRAANAATSGAPPAPPPRQEGITPRDDAFAVTRERRTPSRPVLTGVLLMALVALVVLGVYGLTNRGEPVQASQTTTPAAASDPLKRSAVAGPSPQPPAESAPPVRVREFAEGTVPVLEFQETLRDRMDRIQRETDQVHKDAIRKINQ